MSFILPTRKFSISRVDTVTYEENEKKMKKEQNNAR